MVAQEPRAGQFESESDAALRAEFDHLTSQWKEETMGDSLGYQTLAHPAHLRIISMGQRALPWILRDMDAHGGHWFAALEAITGVDPVPPEDQGYGKRMRESWLGLGRQRGWID